MQLGIKQKQQKKGGMHKRKQTLSHIYLFLCSDRNWLQTVHPMLFGCYAKHIPCKKKNNGMAIYNFLGPPLEFSVTAHEKHWLSHLVQIQNPSVQNFPIILTIVPWCNLLHITLRTIFVILNWLIFNDCFICYHLVYCQHFPVSLSDIKGTLKMYY